MRLRIHRLSVPPSPRVRNWGQAVRRRTAQPGKEALTWRRDGSPAKMGSTHNDCLYAAR